MKALSLQQVEERLGVARKTVLLLIARGKLAGYKVGRQWRFEPADVDAFIANQKAEVARRSERATTPMPPPARRSTNSTTGWKGSDRYTH